MFISGLAFILLQLRFPKKQKTKPALNFLYGLLTTTLYIYCKLFSCPLVEAAMAKASQATLIVTFRFRVCVCARVGGGRGVSKVSLELSFIPSDQKPLSRYILSPM